MNSDNINYVRDDFFSLMNIYSTMIYYNYDKINKETGPKYVGENLNTFIINFNDFTEKQQQLNDLKSTNKKLNNEITEKISAKESLFYNIILSQKYVLTYLKEKEKIDSEIEMLRNKSLNLDTEIKNYESEIKKIKKHLNK